MKVAASTGGIGDIVYAIPVMRKIGVTKIYIKENFYYPPYGSMYTVMKPLLATQGIEAFPTLGGLPFFEYEPGLKFDFDFDKFRYHGTRGKMHIIKSMLLACRMPPINWNIPFLRGFDISEDGYNLVFLTSRWREESKVNWKEVHKKIPDPKYFLGFPEDHKYYCDYYGDIERKETMDMLEMANLIAKCNALYCNQGVALTIAQGLGKQYYCDFKPGKTNTRFYTSNEHNL